MQERTTKGIICVDDEYGFTYCVSEIEYTEWEDESFRYLFRPDYSVIDLLPVRIFQGIPGLNLDLRKECYVRENIVPVFISERTPGENRVDLWELLEKYDMDYLNRLEWLIRSDMRYWGDEFYVIRERPKAVQVSSLYDFGNRSAVICRKALEIICSGENLQTETFRIDDTNRKTCFEVLMNLYKTERKYIEERRRKGIQKAADSGKYKGRGRIRIDGLKLREMFEQYENKDITAVKAAQILGVSKATFDRRYREYKMNR